LARAGPAPGRAIVLGTALFCVLAAAAVIAAVLVVRERTPDLVLEVSQPLASNPATLRPGGNPPRTVEITFFVRDSDDHASVGIVDSQENVVRTLDSDVALVSRDPVTYTWDGRDDAGRLVVNGRYRLEVDLPGSDREMVWPRRITVLSGVGPPLERAGAPSG
jgi:FlgD Ig-like domain